MATGDNSGGIKASSAGLDLNSHKGINVAPGVAPTDALAYGQVFTDAALFNIIDVDDFDGAQAATTGAAIIPNGVLFGRMGWRCGIGGTAANVTIVTTGQDANHFGVVDMATGTTTTGVAQGTQSVGGVTFGSGQVFEQHWLVQLTTLSDGTNTYATRWGWVDNPSAPTNGLYFEYVQGTSVNWRGVALAASVATVASGGSNVAVATGAWIHLKITWDGTTATFLVNGTVIGTLTTGLPAVAVPRGFGIIKSLGTTSRDILTDLYQEGRRWTSARAT